MHIPPDAVHSLRPVRDHAPIHCFCFAVGRPRCRRDRLHRITERLTHALARGRCRVRTPRRCCRRRGAPRRARPPSPPGAPGREHRVELGAGQRRPRRRRRRRPSRPAPPRRRRPSTGRSIAPGRTFDAPVSASPVENTGKPCAASASQSRTQASMTRPAMPRDLGRGGEHLAPVAVARARRPCRRRAPMPAGARVDRHVDGEVVARAAAHGIRGARDARAGPHRLHPSVHAACARFAEGGGAQRECVGRRVVGHEPGSYRGTPDVPSGG